ncbi:hypothetical protein [Halobellus sp. GM3]|uniref:hypothetical protein n=1 Tax=Halobellus sp. GM3 TaxID=3458410 RepID=UPI00403DE09A
MIIFVVVIVIIIVIIIEIFYCLWGAPFISVQPLSEISGEMGTVVWEICVLVPDASVLDVQLPVPLSVWWFVCAVNVDMAALTDWDSIFRPVVRLIAVQVVN